MKLSRTQRLVFGASVAAMATSFISAPAVAQIADGSTPSLRSLIDISEVEREAQARSYARSSEFESWSRPDVSTTELTPQIVVSAPDTPTTARDPVNVTGVGQMVVDQQDGFIGLCTGTLINPRTVIFAAHCVNERPASAYGENSGGQPIGFGFSNNNNTAGASAFGIWLNGNANIARYSTNPGLFMYDANYVSYNPRSLEPDAAGFLYADIAMASLDTPAANVPTWALLFSALPAVPITANGTGYHVDIVGYGNNGTGTTGSTGGIDFRRRIAENTIGALASLDEFENFLFGGAANANSQNLYWIDFDDPRRGTAQASPFDFNAWRDNAVTHEGITASGDSGGPLIIDQTFARSVVIAVLSGGYTRFFNGQPANGYGTAAFYQPLYLYWDWIAANNPYHYVGSVAGNANWNDPTHWVTNLDPNYQIIGPNGQLVNGIPTSPGQQTADLPGFGQACFQAGGVSDCYDVATGQETIEARPIGTGGATSGPALVSADLGTPGVAGDDKGTVDTASLGTSSQGSGTGTATADNSSGPAGPSDVLPPATLVNGLPGATNFVPNNNDGNRLTSTLPRYFDVTLAAAGTTTLNTAVTIDRLTLAGATAALDITAAGSLTSLMSITQGTGTMQVNGTLTTPGDYLMIAGGLNGTGTITTPFFTSMAGTIAPGTAGGVGTLNFRGNVILASATALLIDLGANGVSDRLAVAATTFNGTTPTNGIANLGGVVAFSAQPGFVVRANNVYTILTAQGGRTGTFSGTAALSAILTPIFIYNANSVDVRIQAGLYANVVDGTSAVQTSFASLLDANRASNNSLLNDLYGPLDLQNQATIRAFFEASAPRFETTRTALGIVSTENMSRFYRQRLNEIDPGHATGTLAMRGQPLQLAQNSATLGTAAAVEMDAAQNMVETTTALPDNMSGYVTAGYIDGTSRPMPAAASAGRDQFNGWYVAVGLERELGANATGGFSISYTDLDGETGGLQQQVGGKLMQGTLYAAVRTPSGLRLDGQLSAGQLQTTTRRNVNLVGTNYDLRSNGDALAFSAEGGIGFDLAKGGNFSIVPRASLRYGVVDFGRSQERGGPMALTITRENSESLDGRVGVSFSGHTGAFRPYLSANYVYAFMDRPTVFGAGFVGTQAIAPFALASTDNSWAEIGGGFSFVTGAVTIGFDADTTLMRDDVRNQSYRGRIGIRF